MRAVLAYNVLPCYRDNRGLGGAHELCIVVIALHQPVNIELQLIYINQLTIKALVCSCTLIFNRKKAKSKPYCHFDMLYNASS